MCEYNVRIEIFLTLVLIYWLIPFLKLLVLIPCLEFWSWTVWMAFAAEMTELLNQNEAQNGVMNDRYQQILVSAAVVSNLKFLETYTSYWISVCLHLP
jgi:hypothetical protein